MRILKLIISAFGPFKDEINIDFEGFGDRGIYLITGDTGAGKTTIFDAITYALYGSSSGGLRESKMFRSEYADEDVKTFVELTFAYKKRIYRIYRNPSYERPKMRGEGYTTEEARAALYLDDGTSISKLDQVNKYIEDLFGLNEGQFKQVAMIAQGDFLKLLHASNEEKRALFRKIFSTEKFSFFEDRIRSIKSEMEIELGQIVRSFETIVDNLYLEDGKKEILKTYAKDGSVLFEKELADAVNKDETEMVKLNEQLSDSRGQVDSLKELVIKVKDYISNKKDLKVAELSYKSGEEKLAKLLEEKDKNRDIDQLIEGYAKEISIEEEKLSDYKKLEEMKKELKELSKNFSEAEIDLTENYRMADKLDKRKLSLEKFIEENEDIGGVISELSVRLSDLDRSKLKLDKLESGILELEKDQKELQNYKELLAVWSHKLSLKSSERSHAENIYYASQAGILAKDLEEGRPCPVCGSLTHPSPARLTGDFVEKVDLDKLAEEEDEFRGKCGEYSNKLTGIDTRIISKIDQIKDLLKELELGIEIEEIERHLPEEIGKLEKSYGEMSTELKKSQKIEKELVKAKKDIKDLNLDIRVKADEARELSEKSVSYKTSMEEKNETYEGLKRDLKFISQKDAVAYLDDLKEKHSSLKKKKEKLDSDITDKKTDLARFEASIFTIKSKLDGKYDRDLQVLESQLTELEEKNRLVNNRLQEVYSRFYSNKLQLEKYKKVRRVFEKTDVKYSHIKDIYNTVTGQISGKDKLQFEVFVQMHYFDEIISRANRRLYEMTSGQYQLSRKEGASDMVSQSGLEIEIIDVFSSKPRHIKTLSGGESFKAALALALGLSDTVQMYSGGVELDNMFIDEGFGTLDRESLKQVMASLAKLTESKKLIGIISHVESMKESIDKKIVVKKNRSGASYI